MPVSALNGRCLKPFKLFCREYFVEYWCKERKEKQAVQGCGMDKQVALSIKTANTNA